MKRVSVILLSLIVAITLFAQKQGSVSTPQIKDLEKKRKELQTQISRSEGLLKTTSKDLTSQLSSLSMLTNQIALRKKYIAAIEHDVVLLTREMASLGKELSALEAELADRKRGYEQSLQQMQRNRSMEEKLLFVFSAKTLRQSYRRLRYLQEYSSYQRLQGEEIIKKQEQILHKQQELESTRSEKNKLLVEGQVEKHELEQQEKDRKLLLNNLQRKQKSLQQEIARKRREANQLNARIDKLIEEEIARNNRQTAPKDSKGKKTAPTRVDRFILSPADQKLSANFEQNKGRLPVPITGPYLIANSFGQYSMEGLKNVKLDNKGLDLKGQTGAQARAIFDGEVSAISKGRDGLYLVLVRHGNYISLYSNLSSLLVKKGDRVKTKDVIGDIYSNDGEPMLHFQLRKEMQKVNPEEWLVR